MDYKNLVALAIEHQSRPCIGEPCDLEAPCKRHYRTPELVLRFARRFNYGRRS